MQQLDPTGEEDTLQTMSVETQSLHLSVEDAHHHHYVLELDDGHIPERFRSNNNDSTSLTPTLPPKTRIVDYPLFHPCRRRLGGDGGEQPSQQPLRQHVYVYPNALSEEGRLVHQAYQKTVSSHHSAWGEYVTLPQIQEYWKNNSNNNNNSSPVDSTKDKEKDTTSFPCDLTVALAAEFLALTLGRNRPSAAQDEETVPRPGATDMEAAAAATAPGESSLWTWEELQEHQTHGVAVWALRSPVGSHVPYHLDYAEQVRYQSNVIVPPLVAGTLQCTPPTIQIVGGDYLYAPPPPSPSQNCNHEEEDGQVFQHYATHGYKGKFAEPTDLLSIPYRFNQLTCHLGNVPHASSKVTDIIQDGNQENEDANHNNNSKESSAFRVIVGFNVFPHAIGPLVQKAPEHSEAFRRLVRQPRPRHRYSSSSFTNPSMLSLQKVKDNKGLSKLLVLAKRLKIQDDFRRAQERLDSEIPTYLPTTIQELMNRFCSSSSSTTTTTTLPGGSVQWPVTPTDVQVYLDHQIHKGRYKVLVGGISTTGTTKSSKKDIVSPDTVIGIADDQMSRPRDVKLHEQ